MNPIYIRKRLDSDLVHLPELKTLIGKTVEIFVCEETPPVAEHSPYDAFFELAGQGLVDPEAYKRLRWASRT